MYEDRRNPVKAVVAMVALAFVVVIGFIVLFGSWTTIDAGERGVVLKLGEPQRVIDPGFNWKMPFLESVVKVDVRTKTVVYELENPLYAASRDQQDVQVASVVNYRIDPGFVQELYQQYGSLEKYEADIIRPTVRDTVKNSAANFSAEELVTKRGEYNDLVNKQLSEILANFSVTVERVNITNIEFSQKYTQSIEDKETAKQQALKAENDLVRVEFEAQQKIEQAKAEAEAIRIQAEAITQQGGADYVRLKAIEKWKGDVPTTMLPDATVPFLGKI